MAILEVHWSFVKVQTSPSIKLELLVMVRVLSSEVVIRECVHPSYSTLYKIEGAKT